MPHSPALAEARLPAAARRVPWTGQAAHHAEQVRDASFLALQTAFRPTGGLARGDALAAYLSLTGRGGYLALARSLVAGELFSFQWHDSIWVPMFQFEPGVLTRREGPRRVLHEWHGVLDGWAIAHWYTQPNAWLDGRTPLDVLPGDATAVLAAARADRFVIDG